LAGNFDTTSAFVCKQGSRTSTVDKCNSDTERCFNASSYIRSPPATQHSNDDDDDDEDDKLLILSSLSFWMFGINSLATCNASSNDVATLNVSSFSVFIVVAVVVIVVDNNSSIDRIVCVMTMQCLACRIWLKLPDGSSENVFRPIISIRPDVNDSKIRRSLVIGFANGNVPLTPMIRVLFVCAATTPNCSSLRLVAVVELLSSPPSSARRWQRWRMTSNRRILWWTPWQFFYWKIAKQYRFITSSSTGQTRTAASVEGGKHYSTYIEVILSIINIASWWCCIYLYSWSTEDEMMILYRWLLGSTMKRRRSVIREIPLPVWMTSSFTVSKNKYKSPQFFPSLWWEIKSAVVGHKGSPNPNHFITTTNKQTTTTTFYKTTTSMELISRVSHPSNCLCQQRIYNSNNNNNNNNNFTR
jgi:hypothetical protein